MTRPMRTATESTGPQSLGAAVLRISDARGNPVGLGFLVTDVLAFTCAHVVAAALGTAQDVKPAASDRLSVDLPLLSSSGQGGAGATARVEVWGPSQPSGAGDVAVLRLGAPVPGARPVRLVEVEEQSVWDHPARAFGFPAGRPGGVWHAAVLRARQASGWVQADLAADGYRVSQGFSGGPVWDDALAGVVGMMAVAESGDPPVSFLIPTDGLLAVWPELRALALPPSPFRSLTPFVESDAAIFHGRGAESEEVADAVARNRWTTLVGPSGCGKSSLAMAGVIPRRRAVGDCALVMRPAHDTSPLHALAAELLALLEPGLPVTERLAKVPVLAGILSEQGLRGVVSRILQLHGGDRLLVVVDQFEELLALDPSVVDELADVLFSETPPTGLKVLATLRADFLEQALAHPRLGPIVSKRVCALEPMRPEQLRQIITTPIDDIPGARYEHRLVDRILADAGTEPGALPLLGFTLDQLWQRQSGGLLTLQAYEDLGGVTGALRAYADKVWAENVEAQDEPAAEQLFTQLVRVPIGAPAATRRVTPRAELSEEAWRVAQRLAATRLLAIKGSAEVTESVELAHEALITSWSKLASRVAADRSFLDWRESVRHDMDRWERGKRASELLPAPLVLAGAKQWLRERKADLSKAERDYLERGRAHRRARTRRRRAVIALVCVLILVVGAVVAFSVQQSRNAAQKAAVVDSINLAGDAHAASSLDPGMAAQLAIAGYKASPTSVAATQLYNTLGTPVDSVVTATGDRIAQMTAQTSGDLAAAVGGNGTMRIWDIKNPATPVLRATLPVTSQALAFAPHNPLLAGPCPTGTDGLCLWDLTNPQKPAVTGRLPLPAAPKAGSLRFTSIAISPDGALAAAAAPGGITALWSIAQPAHPLLLAIPANASSPSDGAPGVAFSPKGNLLARTALGGAISLWNLANPASPVHVATINDRTAADYQTVAFDPDGTLLAGIGHNNIGLWKIDNPAHPVEISLTGDEITCQTAVMVLDTALSFSPDGRQLAFGGNRTDIVDGGLCLFDLSMTDATGGYAPAEYASTSFGLSTMAYTSTGALYTSGNDGAIRSWHQPLPQNNGLYEPSEDGRLAISPSGRLLIASVAGVSTATNSMLWTTGVWDATAADGPRLDAWLPVESDLAEFLGENTVLTVQSRDVQLWDLSDPHHPTKGASLGTATCDSRCIATDATGHLLSILGTDKALHLWRVTDPYTATEVGSIPDPTSDPGRDVAALLSNGRTVVMSTTTGIEWWDVSDPAHPVHGGTTNIPFGGNGMADGLDIGSGPGTEYAAESDAADGGTGFGRSPFETLDLITVVGGKPQAPVPLPSHVGLWLAAAADGRVLATTGIDGNTVELWDIADPRHPTGTSSFVTVQDITGIAINQPGTLMAVWNPSEVQLWDIRKPTAPALTATVTLPGQPVGLTIRFERSGSTLLVGSDSSVYLYDTDPADLAHRLCSYTAGALSPTQWNKYVAATPYRNPCG